MGEVSPLPETTSLTGAILQVRVGVSTPKTYKSSTDEWHHQTEVHGLVSQMISSELRSLSCAPLVVPLFSGSYMQSASCSARWVCRTRAAHACPGRCKGILADLHVQVTAIIAQLSFERVLAHQSHSVRECETLRATTHEARFVPSRSEIKIGIPETVDGVGGSSGATTGIQLSERAPRLRVCSGELYHDSGNVSWYPGEELLPVVSEQVQYRQCGLCQRARSTLHNA